jgi:hypothetical protein
MRMIAGRVAVALVLLLASIALVSTLPLGWGAADAPDGTRFKVSPLGLSHVLRPHETISPTEECRWSKSDPQVLCAIRPEAVGAAAFFRA